MVILKTQASNPVAGFCWFNLLNHFWMRNNGTIISNWIHIEPLDQFDNVNISKKTSTSTSSEMQIDDYVCTDDSYYLSKTMPTTYHIPWHYSPFDICTIPENPAQSWLTGKEISWHVEINKNKPRGIKGWPTKTSKSHQSCKLQSLRWIRSEETEIFVCMPVPVPMPVTASELLSWPTRSGMTRVGLTNHVWKRSTLNN